eukprot:CAMPEP_0202881836 /NCGR_PEP_ID=MMETSP1391-20130828/37134_1 /ASSEMBLY_ACC=CAM_ASM_000867 /TAXON_ID=1034604 /ORGANISM="Chlamydomonas leiostraca, Strain SAG 11-49" /LENGTH=32 /DNA_ID= /DNA_START= /DNA_END= /DNA_ORIENTATION=
MAAPTINNQHASQQPWQPDSSGQGMAPSDHST